MTDNGGQRYVPSDGDHGARQNDAQSWFRPSGDRHRTQSNYQDIYDETGAPEGGDAGRFDAPSRQAGEDRAPQPGAEQPFVQGRDKRDNLYDRDAEQQRPGGAFPSSGGYPGIAGERPGMAEPYPSALGDLGLPAEPRGEGSAGSSGGQGPPQPNRPYAPREEGTRRFGAGEYDISAGPAGAGAGEAPAGYADQRWDMGAAQDAATGHGTGWAQDRADTAWPGYGDSAATGAARTPADGTSGDTVGGYRLPDTSRAAGSYGVPPSDGDGTGGYPGFGSTVRSRPDEGAAEGGPSVTPPTGGPSAYPASDRPSGTAAHDSAAASRPADTEPFSVGDAPEAAESARRDTYATGFPGAGGPAGAAAHSDTYPRAGGVEPGGSATATRYDTGSSAFERREPSSGPTGSADPSADFAPKDVPADRWNQPGRFEQPRGASGIGAQPWRPAGTAAAGEDAGPPATGEAPGSEFGASGSSAHGEWRDERGGSAHSAQQGWEPGGGAAEHGADFTAHGGRWDDRGGWDPPPGGSALGREAWHSGAAPAYGDDSMPSATGDGAATGQWAERGRDGAAAHADRREPRSAAAAGQEPWHASTYPAFGADSPSAGSGAGGAEPGASDFSAPADWRGKGGAWEEPGGTPEGGDDPWRAGATAGQGTDPALGSGYESYTSGSDYRLGTESGRDPHRQSQASDPRDASVYRAAEAGFESRVGAERAGAHGGDGYDDELSRPYSHRIPMEGGEPGWSAAEDRHTDPGAEHAEWSGHSASRERGQGGDPSSGDLGTGSGNTWAFNRDDTRLPESVREAITEAQHKRRDGSPDHTTQMFHSEDADAARRQQSDPAAPGLSDGPARVTDLGDDPLAAIAAQQARARSGQEPGDEGPSDERHMSGFDPGSAGGASTQAMPALSDELGPDLRGEDPMRSQHDRQAPYSEYGQYNQYGRDESAGADPSFGRSFAPNGGYAGDPEYPGSYGASSPEGANPPGDPQGFSHPDFRGAEPHPPDGSADGGGSDYAGLTAAGGPAASRAEPAYPGAADTAAMDLGQGAGDDQYGYRPDYSAASGDYGPGYGGGDPYGGQQYGPGPYQGPPDGYAEQMGGPESDGRRGRSSRDPIGEDFPGFGDGPVGGAAGDPYPGYDNIDHWPDTAPEASATLWLGIAGLLPVIGLFTAIAALIMRPRARRAVQRSQGELEGLNLVRLGTVLAWVGIGLFMLEAAVAVSTIVLP